VYGLDVAVLNVMFGIVYVIDRRVRVVIDGTFFTIKVASPIGYTPWLAQHLMSAPRSWCCNPSPSPTASGLLSMWTPSRIASGIPEMKKMVNYTGDCT